MGVMEQNMSLCVIGKKQGLLHLTKIPKPRLKYIFNKDMTSFKKNGRRF